MKNLSAQNFSRLLVDLDACSEARIWADGKDLREVWKTCHRGDWMLWLAGRYGVVPIKTIVAVACDCVEPALVYLPATELRPAQCLAVVRRWLKGEATIAELHEAARAARAAAWAARAAEVAAWAAEVAEAARVAEVAEAARVARVARVAEVAAWAARGAEVAARGAEVAAEAARAAWGARGARVARAAARADSLRFSADVCRKYIEIEEEAE